MPQIPIVVYVVVGIAATIYLCSYPMKRKKLSERKEEKNEKPEEEDSPKDQQD